MIKPNKKIGIAYCDNSKHYVNELKKLIIEKGKTGYCIETLVVDDNLNDKERNIEKRVFSNLDKCDYGIVFLTKDLKIEENIFISKPNVLIELGYLKGRLKENSVLCITDFPHADIENSEYILPSDYIGEVLETINKNNYKADLKEIVDNFIRVHNIDKIDHYNANNLINSLLLNALYKTNFETIFSNDNIGNINKYSMEFQQEEIFKIWIEEKEKLSEVAQIIYIFERIVFLPFFPENILSERLSVFSSVENSEESPYIDACRKIIKSICEYGECKRNIQTPISNKFYLDKAKELEDAFLIFQNNTVSPIIECVTRNYIGLCYLNSYIGSKEDAKNTEDLKMAKENFTKVLVLSTQNFSNKLEIFQAFAKYNMARVKRNLQVDAETEYIEAISKRKNLSKAYCMPPIFKLNFMLERIHAEIDYFDYKKENNTINLIDYKTKIEDLDKELLALKQTPAIDVSLFSSLENKLNNRKKI